MLWSFQTPTDAEEFLQAFQAARARGALLAGEGCAAAWSEPLQGLQDLIERYRNSPVMHHSVPEECKPLYFRRGRPVAFPAPTRPLRPPRIRPFKQKAHQNASSTESQP